LCLFLSLIHKFYDSYGWQFYDSYGVDYANLAPC